MHGPEKAAGSMCAKQLARQPGQRPVVMTVPGVVAAAAARPWGVQQQDLCCEANLPVCPQNPSLQHLHEY